MSELIPLDRLLDDDIQDPPFIVDQLIHEGDSVFILGDAKMGKSLLSLQLAMTLTTDEPFLDKFKVLKPHKVLYVQCEGKLFETYARAKKMSKEVPHTRGDWLKWLYLPSFAMDKEDSCAKFINMVGDFNPDVIFFDPLYKLRSTGSLCDDEVAGNIVTALDHIKHHYKCTLIINHHQHRMHRNQQGGVVDEGDNSIFGSFVWRAWPDSIVMMSRGKSAGIVKLTCNTQRSGGIAKDTPLFLVEPNPLYWEVSEDMSASHNMILQLIKVHQQLDRAEIEKMTGLAKSTVNKILRQLKQKKKIRKNAVDKYCIPPQRKDIEDE